MVLTNMAFLAVPVIIFAFWISPRSACDESSMFTVNWHDMLNDKTVDYTSLLLKDYTVNFDESSLSLTLGATLEYVGLSTGGDYDHTPNLGTTYWIDLHSFGGVTGNVADVGSCGNRRAEDYDGLSQDEYWGYTVNPMDLSTSPTSERMAYPPSDWDLVVSASDCNTVRYERTFHWAELMACKGADGKSLVTVEENDTALVLKGTFFVEMVSPFSAASSGFYRTFPLLQRDFEVRMDSQVDVATP